MLSEIRLNDWRKLIAGPLRNGFRWWIGELTGMVPAPVRRRFLSGRSRLVLVVDAAGNNLYEENGDRRRSLGRIDLDASDPIGSRPILASIPRSSKGRVTDVVIRFDTARALHTPASLPLAVEKNLSEVVGFEFERLVPFKRPDVYYSYRIVARDKSAQLLRLELLVLPRADVARVARSLDGFGLRLADVELAEGPAGPVVASIPIESDKRGGTGSTAKISTGLAATALTLALLCLAIPFWRASASIASLTAQVADARRQADAAAGVQREIDSTRQERQYLLGRKRTSSTVTEILAKLTNLLPDDAYLTELSVAGDRLHLVGAAGSATALLTLIDQSQAFRNAAFQSSIVQDSRLNRERFDITARIAERAGE
jgi:general secretion pathway protein L